MTARKHPHAECESCPLRDRPYVPGELTPNAQYVMVGESPGADEARIGKPFVGASGDLMWPLLNKLGAPREQWSVLNVVSCVPHKIEVEDEGYKQRGEYDIAQQRVLKQAERDEPEMVTAARCCAGRLTHELVQVDAQHKKVLLLGRPAREALAPGLKGAINTMLGRWHKSKLWTWHPAYVLRAPVEGLTFIKCLTKFVRTQPGTKLPMPPEPLILYDPVGLQDRVDRWSHTADLQLCIDTETDQINWQTDAVLCMGIYDGVHAYVVPRDAFGTDFPAWRGTLARFFNLQCEWILQNAKYDQRFLIGQLGLPARCTFDTFLGHYALDERKGTHDLKGLVAFYFDVEDWELEMQEWIGTSRAHNARYSVIPADNLHKYVAKDVYYTWHLKQVLEQELKRTGLYEWPFKNLLMPASETLVQSEIYGVHIDRDAAINLDLELTAWEEQIAEQLVTATDYRVENPGSPTQIAKYMYDVLELKLHTPPPGAKPKSTGDEVIAEFFEELEHGSNTKAIEFLRLLRQYRRIRKLRTSYVEGILDALDVQHKFYNEFWIPGTETGRIASRGGAAGGPSLLTIPRPNVDEEGQLGYRLRTLVTAPEGHVLINVDYSQCELRVAAHLSQDPFLLKAYRDGRDIHTEITVEVFGPGHTDEQRQRIKVMNFRFLNGGDISRGLYARGESIPPALAKELKTRYDTVMAGLLGWGRTQNELLRRTHYVQSVFGRRRRFPVLTIGNKEEVRKTAINQPIQGAASDLCLLAHIAIYRDAHMQEWGARPLFPMHDSVLIEVSEQHAHACADRAVQIFLMVAQTYMPSVPWKADYKISKKWGERVEKGA